MSFVMNPERNGYGQNIGWSVGWRTSDRLIQPVAFVKSWSDAAMLCSYLNGGSLPLDKLDREETHRWLDALKPSADLLERLL